MVKEGGSEFFRGRDTAGTQKSQGAGAGGRYDSYDSFLASYAEAVEQEVGRLNGLLDGGGSSTE